jgi:hypothetical protein
MIARLLDGNRHVHVAVVGATEVIADRREGACLLRCHCYFYGLTGRDLFVKLQRTKEESVSHVFAVNTQLDGFALRQGDFVGSKGETFGGDVDDRDIARVKIGCAR